MRLGGTLLVWLVLAFGVAAEILAAWLGWQGAATLLGVLLAVLVALTFMRLGSSAGLVPVFAVAGVFWLCVLLGLGSMDTLTRHDISVPQRTER